MIYQDNQLVREIHIPHVVNGFEYQIETCMQSIQQNMLSSDVMTHQDSIGVLTVMDNIRSQIGVKYPAAIELV